MSSLAMHRGFRVPDGYYPCLAHRCHVRRPRAVETAPATASPASAAIAIADMTEIETKSDSEATCAMTALAESVSETWNSVVGFFSSHDGGEHVLDAKNTKTMTTMDEERDDGADTSANDDASDATDASSDSDADTEATTPDEEEEKEEEEEVARVSSTTITMTATTSTTSTSSSGITISNTSSHIKCDVSDLAKRVYVLVKIAMAAISRQCVAAMQWVLGVCGTCSVRSGTTTTASTTTIARSSGQAGSSSSCSSVSASTSSSVSASMNASPLFTAHTPIPVERASQEAGSSTSVSLAASSQTSANIPVAIDIINAIDAIVTTIVESAVVDPENHESASTIEVVAIPSESKSDSDGDEADEKMEEHLDLCSEEEDSQAEPFNLVVVAPTPPPPPSIAMAPWAMLTRTLMEAAVAEQLKCEDQLVNVLRCVLLASNWHAQADEGSCGNVCIRVTRVAFTASLPVHEPVIGTTALLSVHQARAALVHQRAIMNSAAMACCATMACLATGVDALLSVHGDDGGDGAMIEDALWLFERHDQLMETAWLAFRWLDQLLDALDAVDEAGDGEWMETTTTASSERAGVSSAWCEPPEDEADMEAAWVKWVETWANETAPLTFATRAMPRQNLTPVECASMDQRISAFRESVRHACPVKAAPVAPVPESVQVPVASDAAQASSTSTTSTTTTEATEATPSTGACGSEFRTTSTSSQAPAPSKATVRCGVSPSRVSSGVSATSTPAIKLQSKPEVKSKLKSKINSKPKSKSETTAKARWRSARRRPPPESVVCV